MTDQTPRPSGSPATTTGTVPAVAPVTAVVVARGATGFLPTTLRALAAQTRTPARVLLVDVADRPDPALAAVVRAAGLPAGTTTLLTAPGARTYGDAVRTALGPAATADPDDPADTRWLWLLHDDSAPEPTALAELVRAVEAAPSVGVAGVKQRTWTAPARLLEVGVRTTRSGRRMTDVEPGEVDQGQHDGRDDVLGVGLVAALVRRDVWQQLGGTDPALGPFGDGIDLCRRARLAGHRVVVVPAAVVRHAQAGYHGLRGARVDAADVAAVVDLDADGEPDGADPRQSYAARRTALLHQRLVWAPLPLVPLVAVMAVLAGVVRVLVRIATKEPVLAAAEVAAPLRALARPGSVARARARARRTSRLPRRTLRPLQADWRTVWRQWQDRRLTRAEARRVVRAPSELELRELAALALRRRSTLAGVATLLVLVTVVAFGPLVLGVLGGGTLVGGALVPAAARIGDLWDAATSGWVSGGLGAGGPTDALLAALLPATTLAGGSLGAALAVLLLGSVVLAGVGAWFAAGAATRSVGVRAWAAIVWAALPSLLLAAGQGRAGAVLVHVALPWLVLALARAVGAQQTDVVLSGVLTAAHDDEPTGPRDPAVEEWPDPEAWARAGQGRRGRGRRRRGPDGVDGADGESADDQGVPDEVAPGEGALDGEDVPDGRGAPDREGVPDGEGAPAGLASEPELPGASPERDAEPADATPVRGTRAVPARVATPTRASVEARVTDLPAEVPTASTPPTPPTQPTPPAPPTQPTPPAPPTQPTPPAQPAPSGSVAAAAAASLAFAAVAAGAPVLLVPGLLLLLLVACCAPRGRRLRVLAAAVPAVVLLGPTLVAAVSRGAEGLRLLVADPGTPLASDPAAPLAMLLGVPVDATAIVPTWVPAWVPVGLVAWWPAVTGGAVVLVALLALLRSAPQARVVRLGWCAAAVGVATAVVSSRVVVAVAGGDLVVGWAGAGVSVAAAGLLTAAVVGTRGVRARLDRASFGWRQLSAGVLVLLVVVLPAVAWVGWAGEARGGRAAGLSTLDHAVVPAIGRQTQQSEDTPRVLALAVSPDGIADWQLLRGDGPQFVEDAAAPRTADLTGPLTGDPEQVGPDAATAEVQDVVGRLSVGSSSDVAADLAALAVADVLVPPLPADRAVDVAAQQARTALVGRLDATPGLERITEGDAGVIWRVQPSGGAPAAVSAWARLVPDATVAHAADGLAGSSAQAVAAVPGVVGRVDTTIGAGGTGRLLVLAERADADWSATLDGRPLRAVTEGWRQTFEVGAAGGRLVVVHGSADETAWTVVQVVVGGLALLLALPVRRRRAGRR